MEENKPKNRNWTPKSNTFSKKRTKNVAFLEKKQHKSQFFRRKGCFTGSEASDRPSGASANAAHYRSCQTTARPPFSIAGGTMKINEKRLKERMDADLKIEKVTSPYELFDISRR